MVYGHRLQTRGGGGGGAVIMTFLNDRGLLPALKNLDPLLE